MYKHVNYNKVDTLLWKDFLKGLKNHSFKPSYCIGMQKRKESLVFFGILQWICYKENTTIMSLFSCENPTCNCCVHKNEVDLEWLGSGKQ